MTSAGPNIPADMPLIERLAAIPYTGAVSDILDEMGRHQQALPHSIQSLVPGQTLAGRALTLFGEPSEIEDPDIVFPPVLRMLGAIRLGDVLAYQANDNVSAHLGELSSETAKFRGARGAVIDGGARDTEYMFRLGFPVFARYKTPLDIRGRWRLVDWNVPIVIGSVAIAPGDLMLGDRDGVIVIPQTIAEEVVTKAEEVVHTENLVRAAILQGVLPLEAYQRFGRF
ncbi:MAG TPA: RraA family protein [Terriglobia bacterium]|nr:RraA family protein [Terriglobia bacterium]